MISVGGAPVGGYMVGFYPSLRMCVCTYVILCTYVRMYMCMYVHIYKHTFVYVYINLVYVFVGMRACICCSYNLCCM